MLNQQTWLTQGLNKRIIGTMMQITLCHSLKQQPGLGMSAYWSLFANDNSDNRTSEICKGFLEYRVN
jgi:hypothetical protein